MAIFMHKHVIYIHALNFHDSKFHATILFMHNSFSGGTKLYILAATCSLPPPTGLAAVLFGITSGTCCERGVSVDIVPWKVSIRFVMPPIMKNKLSVDLFQVNK